jgi:FixJ family two-component response regulator
VIEVDSAAKPVVLVVNDDASTRESLAHLLRSASLSVTTLASVEDYLALKRRSVPACLVLDMEMPATNGLELLSAMAERNDNTPTIFVSGQGDLRTCVRIMKAGASDFLPKPLKIEELLAAIQQALDRSLAAIEQQRLLGDKLSHVADPLKPRELELLKLLIEGRSTTEIAARLGSSSASIRNQRSLLIEKCHRSLENQPPCEA